MTDRPDAHLAGVRRSHARLLGTIAAIDDATARRPSLLPGWDVAMVVTHLARNADPGGPGRPARPPRRWRSRSRSTAPEILAWMIGRRTAGFPPLSPWPW